MEEKGKEEKVKEEKVKEKRGKEEKTKEVKVKETKEKKVKEEKVKEKKVKEEKIKEEKVKEEKTEENIKHNNEQNIGNKKVIEMEEKINKIPDFIKSNKLRISKKYQKYLLTKKLSPKKNDPIKVKLTPLVNKYDNKDIQNSKDLNYTFRNEKTVDNMLYLSPLQQEKSFDNTINDVKSEKNFKYTQSFNNIKDPNSKKFSTPYRRININQKKDRISPSAKVIIENFNYNNVYNINIDNDKEQKNKDKNLYNNKNHKNKELNRFTHKYITYNKPKTTSNLTIKCIISKKGEKNNYNDAINNDSNYRKGTFYSRFITEGNYLKNEKDNFVINASSNSRNKKLNEENNSYQKNNIKANDTNSNLSNKSNSYSIKTFRLDKSNSTHKLSLNNNVYLKNIPNTPKPFSSYLKTEKIIDNFSVISFNLNDLNIFDDKLNQIIYKLKNKTSTNIEIYNECYEFIKFYSNSTIKGIFTTYFKDNNKLIIESSINLSLFSIIIIYHLSKNNLLMKNIFQIVDYILFLLKINFTLYIKKLQLYYNINISNKNYIYFKSYNNFLNDNNITNAENEVDITFRIYQNCKQMTNNMKLIMEYYKKINTIYYNNFVKIFNNISMHNEEELFNYFFTKILKMKTIKKLTQTYKSTEKDNKNNNKNNLLNINYRLKRNKTNENFWYFSPGKKKSIFENLSIKRGNYKINKQLISSTERLKKIALKEKMKKIWGKGGKVGYGIGIPYIREQTSKKYTLILDLNKTLGYYNEEGKVILRNGLFSFLDSIKPFYELISFCGEQKYITDGIIKEIEKEKKYFDYNLNRDNCIIYENNLVKDISFIGRDMTKIIVVDDDENCFKLNKENAIKISTFNGYNNKDKNNKNNSVDNNKDKNEENNKNNDDNILIELKELLILIYKENYDDTRNAIKEFSNIIKNKISLS